MMRGRISHILWPLLLLLIFAYAAAIFFSQRSNIIKEICPYSCSYPPPEPQYYDAFICPQSFRDLAHWTYQWNTEGHKEIVSGGYWILSAPCLKPMSIVYVRGWYMDDFFRKIYPRIPNKFILITGDSDLSTPAPEHEKYVLKKSKIVHWFGQNGRRLKNARFSMIPIGLNCRQHVTGIKKTWNLTSMDKVIKRLGKLNQEDHIENDYKLMLVNFDPTTDSTGERQALWNRACNPSEKNSWQSFAECYGKSTGVNQYISSMKTIYERNIRYKFWLSPKGNGADCHRNWEAILLGRIPVMKSSDIDELFDDLPVVIVNSWDKISRDFLIERWYDIQRKISQNKFRFEKLRMDYWIKPILKKARLNSTDSLRCWQLLESKPPK